jgi:hypothetical protein
MLSACIQEVLVWISASTPAILPEIFHGFPQSLQANFKIVPQLDHGCFLPNPFQFIDHPTIWCHTVLIPKTLLNNLFHSIPSTFYPSLNFSSNSLFSETWNSCSPIRIRNILQEYNCLNSQVSMQSVLCNKTANPELHGIMHNKIICQSLKYDVRCFTHTFCKPTHQLFSNSVFWKVDKIKTLKHILNFLLLV